MIEICNYTRAILPKGLESKLDFALDFILDFAQSSVCKISCDNKVCVELIFVGMQKMRKINKEFLGKDYATDVLSFPLDFDTAGILNAEILGEIPLGSIVINLPLARKNSKEFTHSLEEEIMILFIHAALHLLGFDHERDKGEHRQKEREIMHKLGLSKNIKSLILRANSPS